MTHERTDLYTILGLSPQATQDQITHAYRGLLRQHHPDTRDLTATAQTAASDTVLQQVLAAYAVLGDPARRATYDRNSAIRQRDPTRQPQDNHRRMTRRANPPPIQVGPVRWHR